MIRKLQRWFQSQLGPAVRVEYNPVIGKWRVQYRYGSWGIWLSAWNRKTFAEEFDNINDAYETMAQHREKLCIDKAGGLGKYDRIISFASTKVRW